MSFVLGVRSLGFVEFFLLFLGPGGCGELPYDGNFSECAEDFEFRASEGRAVISFYLLRNAMIAKVESIW